MFQNILEIKPFDVAQVTYYVFGTDYLVSERGKGNSVYGIISFLTGRPKIALSLMALTQQATASNPSEMTEMEKYGKAYLRKVASALWEEGFLVINSRWDGIISPHNLAVVKKSFRSRVWEFRPHNNKSRYDF